MSESEPELTPEQKVRRAEIAMESAELDLRAKALATAKSEAEAAAGILPDLGTVAASTLDVSGDAAIGGGSVGYVALRKAAAKVVERLDSMGDAQVVVVTSEPDLASRITSTREVLAGLDVLESSAASALEPGRPPTERAPLLPFGVTVGGATSAVSAAIPGLLSLFSAKRAVKSSATTPDDLAACAEVVRAARDAQKGGRFIHDTFRVPPPSGLWSRVASLAAARQQLARRQADTSSADAEAAASCASVGAAIDAFLTLVRSVPTGRSRSLLADAALAEGYLATPRPRVLLIKANSGTTSQFTDNRPMFFDDRFFTASWASITHFLIDTDDSQIAMSGVETGYASLRGDIDGDMTLD